jgi:Tfp pilus assembly protein PilN
MRGGPLAYIVLGALVAVLAGVTVLVITNNQISDRKAEVTQLKAETAAIESQTAKLAAYTQFHNLRAQRVVTVTNLAHSRFDWERIMRELSLVLPDNVWLTNLTGTVSPSVQVDGSAGIALRASVPGPALEMVGCAPSQDAVAEFVSVLKDIDGVTRVGMQSSKLPAGAEAGASAESDSASADGGCQTRKFIALFQIVVAFDAAPVPTVSSESAEVTAAPETTTPAPEG